MSGTPVLDVKPYLPAVDAVPPGSAHPVRVPAWVHQLWRDDDDDAAAATDAADAADAADAERGELLAVRWAGESLAQLDRADLLWFERQAIEARIDRQVNSLWWTDEIRRAKPTPQKEAQQGLDIVEASLWKSVPAFLRRIDAELTATPEIGKPLPPDVAPVKFGS